MNILIIVTIIIMMVGLFFWFCLVQKKMFLAQLGMNFFSGKTQEFHPGLTFKVPWVTLQKPEIRMNATVLVTSGGRIIVGGSMNFLKLDDIPPTKYETVDGVLFGYWAVEFSPLKKNLYNFLQKTPMVAARMLAVEMDEKLSKKLILMENEEAIKKIEDISNQMRDLFDPNGATQFEIDNGIDCKQPKLFQLNLGEKSQDAKEGVYVAKQFNKQLKALDKEIDNEKANLILTATGKAKKQIFTVEGAEALEALAKIFF